MGVSPQKPKNKKKIKRNEGFSFKVRVHKFIFNLFAGLLKSPKL